MERRKLPVPPMLPLTLTVAPNHPEASLDPGRPSLRVLHGGILEAPLETPEVDGLAGIWPLHSPGTFATSLLVVTTAVAWLVTVAALTAPTMAAGELLARAARFSEGA